MRKLKEVENYLKNKLHKNDTIVIGVSGGPDSMCLFSLLLKLKEELALNIICAHVNHNVRATAIEEAEFVQDFAQKNNCVYEYLKITDYEKENFESFARQKRYQFFAELITKYQANYLMTAHHGDDLIETICMRLIRGSNLKGYAGFKKETKKANYEILRPLIYVTKNDIYAYNHQNNIPYRLDESNDNITYTRNRIRKQILPILKQENKNIHRKFLKFSEELSSIETFLEDITNKSLTKVGNFDKLDLQEFNHLPEILQKRIIEYLLQQEYHDDISDIKDIHVKKILEICHSPKANITITLPKYRRAIKSYNTFYINHHNNEPIACNKKLETRIKINERAEIIKLPECPIKKSNYVLRLNSQEISLPLYVRYRKPKDCMEVKNLHGSKKIKDIFINEKIPLEKRDSWPIVVDSNDTILWIPGVKKSKFDKNIDEFYDIIYKYVMSEEN